ncbi:LacI family DNA-binding transcriptional regulator [Staphylococcus sp. AS1337]|uniref:LacI family DNA-binding transcriptional regulator n=1 Tax=Staphylococcus sp. AS1337 TaxID=3434042 RepID=UPI003F56C132
MNQKNKTNNVTMKDIALYTGFSTATVSRVLNNNYPVSSETRDQILNAFEQLNYEPNLVAKSLRSNKSNLVAIIVADIENPYYMTIAKQIDKYLFKKGYNLITCSTDESIEKEEEIIRMLLSKNIDAIAISPCDSKNTNLKEIQNRNIPIILIDRKLDDYQQLPYIGTDNFKESYELTKKLIAKGHEKLGIVTGSLNTSTGIERLNGFKAALSEYGLAFQEEWMFNGQFKEDITFDLINEYLYKGLTLPTGIVICNNVMTKGALTVFDKYQIKIPQDLSVVSYGSLANNNLFKVKVTSLEQDLLSMGEAIAISLLSKLEDQYKGQVEIKSSKIIEGNSIKRLKE